MGISSKFFYKTNSKKLFLQILHPERGFLSALGRNALAEQAKFATVYSPYWKNNLPGFNEVTAGYSAEGICASEILEGRGISFTTADLQAAFPEKKDYDYASETSDPAGSAGEARQRYRDVRDQASQEVAAAIDQYERGGQQPAAAGQQLGSGARGSADFRRRGYEGGQPPLISGPVKMFLHRQSLL